MRLKSQGLPSLQRGSTALKRIGYLSVVRGGVQGTIFPEFDNHEKQSCMSEGKGYWQKDSLVMQRKRRS
jgi:hypothetical protein